MNRLLIAYLLVIISHDASVAQNGEAAASYGEGGSRSNVSTPPASQVAAAEALAAANKQQQIHALEQKLAEMRQQIAQQESKRSYGGYGPITPRPHRSRGRSAPAASQVVSISGLPSPLPRLLVIPDDANSPQQIAEILQNMKIMSRILKKELNGFLRDDSRVHILGDRSPRGIEGLYLEGYGLVFRLEVDFPLVSQGAPDPSEQEEEPADKVWQETRREIFEPAQRRRSATARQAYDPDQVAKLKDSIARTLKHASNIRELKSSDQVVITVISTTTQNNSGLSEFGGAYGYSGQGGGSGGTHMLGDLFGSAAYQHVSVLNIKATKADIDAFAQGTSDLEQFQSSLQFTHY